MSDSEGRPAVRTEERRLRNEGGRAEAPPAAPLARRRAGRGPVGMRLPAKIAVYALVTISVLIVAFPLLWMIAAALKTQEQQRFFAAAAVDPGRAAALWTEANDERNRSYFAELRSGERDAADVEAGGYEAIAIGLAAALTAGTGVKGSAPARLILNVRNGGTVPALAPDAVIETVCRVDSDGAVPLPAAPPSDHELGLMSTVKSCERAIASAALTGSAADALRSFALHPLVGSLDAARTLAAAALTGAAAFR